MSRDISDILNGWDFDSLDLNVRIVRGDDGRDKIQMRIDLGLLQMELDGRPDGKRPDDFDSLLDKCEAMAQENGEGYKIPTAMLDDLFREGWQYYQRYLSLFHLGLYPLVLRDTQRNLRLFRFVKERAKRKRDQWRFDQYRPYVLMMQTRAEAMMSLQKGDKGKALEEIVDGQRQIEEFLREYGHEPNETECFELDFLRRWHEELSAQQEHRDEDSADSAVSKMRSHLQKAVDREDYEYAALLRDQIKRLEQQQQQQQ